MRSPGCRVGYIDVDGMKKVWKTKTRTSTATITATRMMIPHSIIQRRDRLGGGRTGWGGAAIGSATGLELTG